MPVSVITPISIPATATAATTGSTLRTVSIITSTRPLGPIRVSREKTDTIRAEITQSTAAAEGV